MEVAGQATQGSSEATQLKSCTKLKNLRRKEHGAEMEIERASSPEFDEERLKPPEDKKEITEINGNSEENGNENDIDIGENGEEGEDGENGVNGGNDENEEKDEKDEKDEKEEVKEEEEEEVKDIEPVNESADITENEEINESVELNDTSELNGSVEINGDSETKPADDSIKEEKEDKEDEVMEQDGDPEPEPTPEPPEEKGEKLAEPLFDEDLVDGFSFCSFDNYNVLEEVGKWSAQNFGKHPDPWYKLKFRPKEKPVKIKKEKPVKELTEKQKKKLEKVSNSSNSEKGYICDIESISGDKGSEGVGDLFSAQKPIPVNGLPHSQKRPNGIQQPGPINFSLPNPSRYPRPHQGIPRQPLNNHHQQQRAHSGLYRPYDTNPTSARAHPGQSPSHQNPAPRQIYSAPSVYPTHGNYQQANYSNSQVHPAYRPPGTTTAGPVPAHHKAANYSYPQGHQYQNYYQNHHNRQAYQNYHQSQQHHQQHQQHQQHHQHQQHQQHQQHHQQSHHQQQQHHHQQQQQQHQQQQQQQHHHPQTSLHTPYSHYGNAQHPSYPQKQAHPYHSSHLHGSSHSSQPSHLGHVLPNGLVQTSPTTGTTSTHTASSPRGHSPNRERDSYSSNISSLSQGSGTAASSGSVTPNNPQHHKPNPWQSSGAAQIGGQQQAAHGNAGLPGASAVPGQTSTVGATPSHNQHQGVPTSSVPTYPQSATLAPNPRLPTVPGQRPTSSGSDILRQELDSRFLSSSDRNLASTIGPPPYMRGEMHQPTHQQAQAHHSSPHGSTAPAILPSAPMMKDVPKLGGPDSLFYRAGMGPPGFPPRLPLAGSAASAAPFSAPGVPATTAPKKTGKWNAMHVRIAWEIYNHQQKAKTDAKNSGNTSHGSPLGPPKHGSSFDLLNKPGGPPGADYLGKRPGPPQDLLRAHNPSSIFPGSMGLPTPPNPFDPLSRDPFGAQRFYGSSHLAAPALAAYPRYPAPGSTAPPFGGLGAIIPPGGASHLAHPRSNLGPPPLSSVPSTLSSQDRYSAYRAPVSTVAGWPLKSESSLINHKEKERRDFEEKERFEQERRAKEKREAEERERKQKEDLQRSRDSDIRNSREGFPAYVKEKDRNGDEAHRERSPLRMGSSPIVNPSDNRTESPRVKPNASFDAAIASPLVKKDSESRSESNAGVDMRIGGEASASRPSSSLSHEITKPSDLSLKPSELTKKEEKIDNDISIIAEKEGNRSGANSVTGRTSVNSDHSISRLNGLDIDPRAPHRDHGSPIVTNGLKSDSPSIKHIPSTIAHQSYMYPASQTRPAQAPVPPAMPSSAELLGRSSYGLAAHHMAPPASMHDPRTLAMFPHLMGQSLRAPNPFDYPSLDPFRDPYRMDLLGRDPLREAREREMMRLNPLGSLVNSELERAKALGLAGYPSLPTGYPGYPTATTLATASLAHKMVPPHLSSLYSSPSMAPGLGFPHPGLSHAMGLNGVPGSNPQFNGKDPLRR